MNTVALKPRTIDVSEFERSKRLGAWTDALNENWYALDLTDPVQTFENGRFGFFDKYGKLQVTNYSADPYKGFHAEGAHVH